MLLCIPRVAANAAGLQLVTVPADANGPALAGAVWYPCAASVSEVKLGRLAVPAAKDCPVTGDGRPLIVISHGFGGKMTGHHDTAEALAEAGFVVAAINHPVDTGPDMSRAFTVAMLTERPTDIKRLIDYMVAAWPDHAKLDPKKIGFFGFSRGGYTGLVLIGANPDLRKGLMLCPEQNRSPICNQLRGNDNLPTVFTHDGRIRAAVIVDPGFASLFTREGVQSVTVPVQLWASALSAENKVDVTPEYVEAIRDSLLSTPEYHFVANAGHYAFLTPCPPLLATELPQLCTDRPGFDRVAFHRSFDAAVVAFFRQHLPAPGLGGGL